MRQFCPAPSAQETSIIALREILECAKMGIGWTISAYTIAIMKGANAMNAWTASQNAMNMTASGDIFALTESGREKAAFMGAMQKPDCAMKENMNA